MCAIILIYSERVWHSLVVDDSLCFDFATSFLAKLIARQKGKTDAVCVHFTSSPTSVQLPPNIFNAWPMLWHEPSRKRAIANCLKIPWPSGYFHRQSFCDMQYTFRRIMMNHVCDMAFRHSGLSHVFVYHFPSSFPTFVLGMVWIGLLKNFPCLYRHGSWFRWAIKSLIWQVEKSTRITSYKYCTSK